MMMMMPLVSALLLVVDCVTCHALPSPWEPANSMPLTAGVGRPSPAFLSDLKQWCHDHRTSQVSPVECTHAVMNFCRGHHRLDAWCLLIAQQHFPAIMAYHRFGTKPSFHEGTPDVSLVYPYDGFEALHQEVEIEGRLVRDKYRAHQRATNSRCSINVTGIMQNFETGTEPGIMSLKVKLVLPEDATPAADFPVQMVGWDKDDLPVPGPSIHISKLDPPNCAPRPDWEEIRVYDVFLFNGEFRQLQVRLHELAPVVHTFVIIEYDRSFRGRPKNFTLEEYLTRPESRWLDPFLPKIRYMPISLAEELPSGQQVDWIDAWTLEHFQRDAIIRGLVHVGARMGDLVLLLDTDELVRREMVETIHRCQGVDLPAILELDFYRYNLHWKVEALPFHAVVSWVSLLFLTSAVTVRYSVEINQLTAGAYSEMQLKPMYRIADAGWHFSYFMTPQAIAHKIGQFAHAEYDREEFRDEEAIRAKIEAGEDLYTYNGARLVDLTYNASPDIHRLPHFIHQNPDQNRDWLPHYRRPPNDSSISETQPFQPTPPASKEILRSMAV